MYVFLYAMRRQGNTVFKLVLFVVEMELFELKKFNGIFQGWTDIFRILVIQSDLLGQNQYNSDWSNIAEVLRGVLVFLYL